MGLLRAVSDAVGGSDDPEQLVEAAMERRSRERVEKLQEAIAVSRERNDGESACPVAHLFLGKALIDPDDDVAALFDEETSDLAYRHLRRTKELLERGREEDQHLWSAMWEGRAQLAEANERWGLAVDRAKTARQYENASPEVFRVLARSHEELGNADLAASYHQQLERQFE